jgi:hypothetical protein
MTWLILLALATHFLTYLVTDSSFPPIERARDAIIEAYPDSPLAYLVDCPWCVSVYTSAAVVGGADLFSLSLPVPVAWWFACAILGGWLGMLRKWVDIASLRTTGKWLREVKEPPNGST